jgi:hypothetical protein
LPPDTGNNNSDDDHDDDFDDGNRANGPATISKDNGPAPVCAATPAEYDIDERGGRFCRACVLLQQANVQRASLRLASGTAQVVAWRPKNEESLRELGSVARGGRVFCRTTTIRESFKQQGIYPALLPQ